MPLASNVELKEKICGLLCARARGRLEPGFSGIQSQAIYKEVKNPFPNRGNVMADECLTKPCSVCGERITGANWFCRYCKICICLTCGVETDSWDCPNCGRKLE